VRKVAANFPQVAYDEMLVDASTAHIVRTPERFDVLVATNFYGDILSDLASELSGSLGLAGSMMASDTLCCAQAQHGSAPDIQNMNKANPISMMLSGGMLLNWLGEKRGLSKFEQAFKVIDTAIDTVLKDPKSRTADLGGTMGTKEFTQLVCNAI
jgi:3-isopropylmalate dehydrogenase